MQKYCYKLLHLLCLSAIGDPYMYMQYARSKVIIIYGDKNTSKSLQKISVYDVNERVQCKDEAVDKTIDSEKNRFLIDMEL